MVRHVLAMLLIGACGSSSSPTPPAAVVGSASAVASPTPGSASAVASSTPGSASAVASPEPDARVALDVPKLPPPPNLDAAKVAAGKQLFATLGKEPCATCHGDKPGRAVPTLWGTAAMHAWGRDGRATSLEAITREMAVQFSGAAAITDEQVGALVEYTRSLECRGTAYDRYAAGDTTALTDAQIRGYLAFTGTSECSKCHAAPWFSTATDREVYFTSMTGAKDPGREAVTHEPRDRGTYKPPSLRGVTRSAPYMHDGGVATLAEAIDHMAKSSTTPADLADIAAFLAALDCP